MNIIICLDDNNGMMFNKRRQSQDRILRADLKEFIKDKDLYMNNYLINYIRILIMVILRFLKIFWNNVLKMTFA